jgi:hypothetical protein
LDHLKVIPNDKRKVQNPGNIGKIVDKFEIDPNVQMDVLQANQVYRPHGYNSMCGRFIYQGSDLEAPIQYPNEGEDFNHLIQYFFDKNPKARGERKLNSETLVQFLRANGMSMDEIRKNIRK